MSIDRNLNVPSSVMPTCFGQNVDPLFLTQVLESVVELILE